MTPGECIAVAGVIELNAGRKTVNITVSNTGDRPIQIGSHFNFSEVNQALRFGDNFERSAAKGMRLNIPAGTAVRFEPGDKRDVELVKISGTKD